MNSCALYEDNTQIIVAGQNLKFMNIKNKGLETLR